LSFELAQLREHIQIARAEIRTAIRDAAHAVEFTIRIEEPIRINEKIRTASPEHFSLMARTSRVEMHRREWR
jgi:hypothetical protein